MLDRFYIPGPWPSDVLTLAESEAHHLLHVLRKARGDRIAIFDGQGQSAEAEVISLGRRDAEARVISQVVRETATLDAVWVAVAPPKGERLKNMIEKLTEVGVDRIILLNTERTVVHPGDARTDKLQQAAIAACKQCGRNRLPEIVPATPLDAALEACKDATIWVADQQGRSDWPRASNSNPCLDCGFVGPEGGFTPSEERQFEAAEARPLSLSRHILRIETAAVLAAGWLMGRHRAE